MLPAGSLAAILGVQPPLVPDHCPGLAFQLSRYFCAMQNAFNKSLPAQIHQNWSLLLAIKSPNYHRFCDIVAL